MLVNHFIEQSAQRFPEKTALISGGYCLTYRNINQDSDCLARFLVSIGVKRQARVAIVLENTADAAVSIFGVLKAGAIFIFLHPTIKATKLAYILRDSGAVALIAYACKQAEIIKAAIQTPDLQNIIWCDSPVQANTESGNNITFYSWEEAKGYNSSSCELPRMIDIDLATIIYTSGSTSEPKGVVCAHYNMVAAARSITTYLKNHENDIIINTLPLSFDYGLYQLIMTFMFGGTVVLEKSFLFPYKILEIIERENVTGFPIVPTIAALLLQLDLSKFNLNSLRYISNTAAALPVAYIKKLQNFLPHVQIYSMYGLTECKRATYLPPKYLSTKPTSVGIPIPDVDAFILDDNGKEVAPHQINELVIRGANVMQGYWNNPEETTQTFRPGRYRGETLLYTGDLFKRDDEGFLYFVGRKDDMIKTKGERVSPKEIEDMISNLEGVCEVAVIGVPDDILGQAIKAFIVRVKNSALTAQAVQYHCAKNLESFLVPKYIEFVKTIPKTNSGKIDKKYL